MSTNLDACDISPVRVNNKHLSTPRRTRTKTSRSEQGIDVHNSCSTPISQQSPRIYNRSLNSPSSSFPYSQENCPDVVWDYSSPKLPKGARRKELKLTVQELLENLNQCQVPECSSQSAPYVKLLEKWMAKQAVNPVVKKNQKNKKENKKKSRNVIEELKKFLETIAVPNEGVNCKTNSRQNECTNTEQEANNTSKLSVSIKTLLDEDTDCDSTEELWGDMDNSFIVKATQDLELINSGSVNNTQTFDVVSTIPDTIPSPSRTPKRSQSSTGPRRHSCGAKVTIGVDKCNDILEQLSNVDWDLDADEWDNGFLIEEDTLSLIPDEVLTGSTVLEGNKSTSSKGDINDTDSIEYTHPPVKSTISDEGIKGTSETTICYTVNMTGVSTWTREQANSAELFNSFEDENFDDESLFCQPEVLSQLDEVENMMSEQPKCTPEEIEKKKDEAMKRRLRNRLTRKKSS